jgi:septal ring factor EnvC (AmiA/AmiB activator)
VWEKIKQFFKKYGLYILAFFSGALAYFGIDTRRRTGVDKNINQLRNELLEYQQLNQQFAERIKELEQRIVSAQDTGDRTAENQRELAEQIERARQNSEIIERTVANALEHANGVDTVTDELYGESEELGQAIGQLREFLEKHATIEHVD